jgi:hypothetical protein
MEVLNGARKNAANERDKKQAIACAKPWRSIDIKEIAAVIPDGK